MCKSISVVLFLALVCTSAPANDITFYFGQPEYYTGTDTSSFVPDSCCSHVGAPWEPVTLGIWANIEADYSGSYPVMDIWNCIAINIVGDYGLTVTNLTMDNFDHRIGMGTAYRWESASDFGAPDNTFLLAAVTSRGLGGLYPREFDAGSNNTDWWSYTEGDPLSPGATYRYWLGNVTLYATAVTGVYFQVGTGAIVRSGGSAEDDLVWFGGDETVPLHGNDFGAVSAHPDFVFPEPASLTLLTLATLFLRRR
jgi:hypothetical protein